MQEIEKIEQEISGYKIIEIPDIKTDGDYSKASDSVEFLNDKFKYVEAERKKMVAPLVAQNRSINTEFKKMTVPLKELTNSVKNQMLKYMVKKEREQLAYEKKMLEDNKDKGTLIVDDKVSDIKQSEFSSNTKKTTTKYRVKDKYLDTIVDIKQNLLKLYLKDKPLPDWMEEYEVESIIVRTK